MPVKELNRIEPQYRAVLEDYTTEYPVKLGALAHDLGLSIKVSSMSTGASGQIRNENGHYVIRVNRYEARERQRFTIAHELAHFLLHRHIIDSSVDGITDNVLYRSGKPEYTEFEANRLASEIVMPAALLRNQFNELGGVVSDGVIEQLAATFQVSKSAMEDSIGYTHYRGRKVVMLGDKQYVPTLSVRASEMNGLEFLPSATKDRLLPCFLLAPWVNSSSLERAIDRIQRAFPNRHYCLDIDRDYQFTDLDSPPQVELVNLRLANGAFQNLDKFCRGIRAGYSMPTDG